MKHRLSYIVALWWVIALTIAGLFLLLLANRESRPSEKENRMLAGFPEVSAQTVFSGDFMTGFESFLSDGFVFRDTLINTSKRILSVFSTLSGDDLYVEEANDMTSRLAAEGDLRAEASAYDEEPTPEASRSGMAVPEAQSVADAALNAEQPVTSSQCFIWFVKKDGSLKQAYSFENSWMQTYSETLRRMKSLLPPDGNICFTQVPLSAFARRWTNQQDIYVGWGSSCEQVLESYLADTQGIYIFNTFDILEPYMTGKVPMFYKTDHHWSAEGAYLVFAEMLRRQGLPVIAYDEYQYKSITGNADADGNRDTFNALYPLLPGHSYVVEYAQDAYEVQLMNYDYPGYLAFMNNSRYPWRRIVTGANTGRKALLICDSFGNAMAPFMLPYYDELHMCDFRKGYYDTQKAGGTIGEMIAHYDISDVYIVTSTANGLDNDNSLKYLPRFLG